jgi:hypothetical protein
VTLSLCGHIERLNGQVVCGNFVMFAYTKYKNGNKNKNAQINLKIYYALYRGLIFRR